MAWSVGAVGPSKEIAGASFSVKVAKDPYTPKDGRLEAAAEAMLAKLPEPFRNRKFLISTTGHLNPDGSGIMTVTVTLEK